MRQFMLLFLAAMLSISAMAQGDTQPRSSATREKIEIKLWPQGAPNSNDITEPEESYPLFVTKVTQPILTIYLPQQPNGLALLACPGGSYLQVWHGSEGHNMAEWYNEQGLVYAVLKYRLPNGHKEVPLSDVHEAMRILKEHQADYGFTQLGIQGCSAGGHLAATAATHYTDSATRPDFQILFYPVISFDPAFTHMLTRVSLIGQDATDELVELYSNEKQVKQDAPPAIILASTDDGLVPARNSIEYANALMTKGISTTLLLYPSGGHGWFGNTEFEYRQAWLEALKTWLKGLQK